MHCCSYIALAAGQDSFGGSGLRSCVACEQKPSSSVCCGELFPPNTKQGLRHSSGLLRLSSLPVSWP